MNGALVAGARTPFCAAGGRLRHVPAAHLAEAAAAAALQRANAGRVVHAVVACAVPGEPDDLQLAARLGGAGRATHVGGLDAAGLEALAVAAAAPAGPVLVVGVDSASRAPYWALDPRHGAARGPSVVADPLAAVIAAAGSRAAGLPGDRAREDAWAQRSHAAVRAWVAELAAVGGVDADEPPPGARDAEALAALKPLFDERATATAGSVALPADGAAAAVLLPSAAAPPGALHLLAAAATVDEALAAARIDARDLVAVEVHEGTAAEALALQDALGASPGIVNGAGGAIGLGHPVAASGIAMALRLHARLKPAGGSGLLVAPGMAVAARV